MRVNKLFLIFILSCFVSITVVQASDYYYDDDDYGYEEDAKDEGARNEDAKDEGASNEDASNRQYNKDQQTKKDRERQLELQMRQWLQELETVKMKKKESSILALTTKILNVDPDNIHALSALGTFYLESGQTQMAKIIFSRLLKKYPKNSSVHSNLGMISLREDNREDAIKAFQKSLEYRYRNYVAAAHLGVLYLEAYEYDSAKEYLELAYKEGKRKLSINHPEVMKIGNNYAVSLSWSGEFRKAEDIFEDLTEIHTKSVELLLNYAILLGNNLGNKKKSYKFLRKADLMDTSAKYSGRIKDLQNFLDKLNATELQKKDRKK